MPKFSKRSLDNLSGVHPDLARVARRAIISFDFVVIWGQRGRADQEAAFRSGASRAHFGQSPHNFVHALAFDACPWPIDWKDIPKFDAMGRVMLAAAREEGVNLTWGGGFRRKDRPHFELTNWRELSADLPRVGE